MNDLLIFIVAVAVCIPVTIFILYYFFKESILFVSSLIWLITQSILAMIAYYMGTRNNSFDLIWAAPLVLLIMILAYYYLFQYIRRPFLGVVGSISDIARGNLNIKAEEKFLNRKDELGIISNEIKKMAANLNVVISQIHTESSRLAKTSGDLNSKAEIMMESSTEQASTYEELASTMEEMASNIRQNSDNASETIKISQNAEGYIQKLEGFSLQNHELINSIAGKISVVRDISFQTNILALNAAVEAARAGEHGRGFAVVANEVKKLAENSKKAADDISGFSGKAVEISSESGKSTKWMLEDIRKLAELIQSISSANIEQNSGAEIINHTIQQLNITTQSVASASEQLASTSEILKSQSAKLESIISFFHH
jgi:methyl-accepting chemotaxis protein